MKKFNVFTCLFYGTVIAGCIYLGFFLGSILHPGMTLYTFVPALREQMANPFRVKVTACTPYTMAAVFLTALLSVMMQKTSKKNYRLLAPMIKCKKTPKKKCRFMAERKKKR